MLGEKKPQKSFFDMAAEQRVSNHFLLKIDRLIDWKPLQKELSKLYHPSLGRPSYPPLVMFKALLLQQWYNLSDRQLEESIRDRISFLRFLGLSIEGPVPDETTICRFRAKLCEVGLAEKLFRLISDQLEQKGLLLKKGSIIDATLIEAARRPPAKGSPATDPDAACTVRGKKLVTIQGDEEAVFAGKGYWRESREHTLRVFEIYCGTMDRAKRNAFFRGGGVLWDVKV